MSTNIPGGTMHMQRLKGNLLNLAFLCAVLLRNNLFSIVELFVIEIFGNKANNNCSVTAGPIRFGMVYGLSFTEKLFGEFVIRRLHTGHSP